VEFAAKVRSYFSDNNAGGVGGQSYAVFLNYPTYYRNAGGTIAQMGVVGTLLANEQKVFDEFKVVSLEVRYLPFFTGQSRVADVAAPAIAGAPASPLLIMGTDNDDAALFTNVNKALNSQNGQLFNKFNDRAMPRMRQRQTDKIDALKWLNLGAIVPSLSAAADPNNPAKLASTKIWVDGYFLSTQTEALILCTWTCMFKGVFTIS